MNLTENAIGFGKKIFGEMKWNLIEDPKDKFRRVAKAVAEADTDYVDSSQLKVIEDEFLR